MSLLRACLLATIAVAAVSSEENTRFAMRWRVYCDLKTGTSFSYPYSFVPTDQYKGNLRKNRTMEVEGFTAVTDEKGRMVLTPVTNAGPAIHHFSYAAADLGMSSTAPLSELGDREAKAKLTWKPYDYYAVMPTRPFGDPKWADDGIEAMIGEADSRCALVVKHGERWSGVVLSGLIGEGDNKRTLDSFEVLSTGRKLKIGDKVDKKAHLTDWREAHCRPGKVVDQDGKLLAPPGGKVQPVSWKGSWEIETEHYHVTANSSPQRLLQHGQYLEALFRAYTKVYEPDEMPPYKFEVHIFNTYREFIEASAAHGFAVPAGGNAIVSGFFAPSLLSLWVYEESGQLGGPEFSIEYIMAHECSHQFLHIATNGNPKVPTWINEGLAVYFESGVFQNGEFQIRPPTGRIGLLKSEYRETKSTLMPLDQYLDHQGRIDASQYGEVFAMTSFWIFGTCMPDSDSCRHKNCGLKRFRDYFQALRAGEDGNEAFERIFMAGMIKAQGSRDQAVDAWQKALMEYVATRLR